MMFGINIKYRAFPFALLFVFGLSCAIHLYWPAFSTWYLREDSRFFAVGFFSIYDLVSAFLEPFNSLGQYRPITKILWSFPAWLGLPIPFTYHLQSFLLLLVGSLALARVFYSFFPSFAASGLVFCVYLLLPLHQKAQYWISAWHNITAFTFFMLALVFRWEMGKATHSKIPWILSLFFLYLGLASREVVFALLPIMLLLDFWNFRSFRRSLDMLALTIGLGLYLFYWNEPFQAAKVQIGADHTKNLTWLFETITNCLANSFWSNGDHVNPIPSVIDRAIAYLVFLAGVALAFFHRGFLLGLLFCVFGLAPFLLVGNVHIEYCMFLACGMVFFLGGLFFLLQTKLKNKASLLFLPLALLLAAHWHFRSLEARKVYLHFYLTQSQMLRSFVESLSRAADKSPPHRLVKIVDFGEYAKLSPALISHHFLILGLDHLVPQRFFLFRNEDLEMVEGTNIKDIIDAGGYWRVVVPMLDPPTKMKYRGGEFFEIND